MLASVIRITDKARKISTMTSMRWNENTQTAAAKICQDCDSRPAEFEIRKVGGEGMSRHFHKTLCKSCLGTVLADDTASILRISRASDSAPDSPHVN